MKTLKINLKLLSKRDKVLICAAFFLVSLVCSIVGYGVTALINPLSSSTGIARVQYARGTAMGGTTVSAAMPSSPAVGDLLVAVIGADGASQAVNSITEPGVAWTQQISAYYAGAQASSSIWAGVIGPGASPSLLVTFASAVGTGAGLNVCEYSGLKTSGFLDKTANDSYTNNPTYSGPYSTGITGTTTNPTELCVGAITLSDSGGSQVSPLNGFVLVDGALIGGFVSVSYLENMVSTYSTYSSGTSASSAGGGWVGCIATFQSAPPAPPTSTTTANQFSFLVEQQGSNFLAFNGATNQVVLNSTNAATVLNYATTNANGVIYIMNGNYPLNASVNVYSDNPLIGESETGVNLYLVAGTVANVIQAINQKNVTIEDLTVNPNNVLNPQTGTPASSAERLQCGISLQGCSVGLIQQVNELNAGWDGIQVYNSANVIINQCNAYKNSWHGIQLWSCTGNNIIEGCTASLVGAANAGIVDELAVGSSSAIATITGNTVSNCYQGIFVDDNGISTTNVVNNQLFGNTNGVDVQLSSNVQVTGNLINQPSSTFNGPGIFVQYAGAGCSNGIISQNTLIVYGHGIYVDSANDFIISENNIQGKATSGRAGIYVNGSAANGNFGSINNNIIYNFVIGINITGPNVVNAVISNNQFNTVTTKITDLGTSTRIYTNLGYNSLGHITNPISSGGNTLVDSGSSSTWVSGRTYTNIESSKVLYISGGTVTAIVFDGTTLFTSATTCNIILQPGDTFSVTFSSAPKIVVFAQ